MGGAYYVLRTSNGDTATMARLDKLPEQHIIKGMKGKVDFYEWKGIAVARKWPRKAVPTQTPEEIATWNYFRKVTQSWKDLDPIVVQTFNGLVSNSSQRNFDFYQSSQYGYQWQDRHEWIYADSPEESMLSIPIAYSPSITPATININTTLYTQPANLTFLIPFHLMSFNRYRLVMRAASNAAGQTVAVQAQEFGTTTPLGFGTEDLTIPNTQSLYDTGDQVISSAPVTATQYALGLKGSNSTVDLSFLWATLYLWQE